MYGIIDRAYGFELRNVIGYAVDESHRDFLVDLVGSEEGSAKETFDEWTLESLLEYIEESAYCWTSYSGSGNSPLVIGISLSSWAYWGLEGHNGIIESAQVTEPTEAELIAFNKCVPKEVQDIMSKHGIEPRLIWTASTS